MNRILLDKPFVHHHGFTMIELVVVILMIGILAVTALPKFFTATGFQEYSYQAEVITKLRAIQLRAMQQTNQPTNSSVCHTVLVTELAMGIPNGCDTSATTWHSATTSVLIPAEEQVTFDVTSGSYSFSFDSMGRPSCTNCLITLLGASGNTLLVTIESEGYIHES